MIGPALVASTWGKVWSSGSFSMKSTVNGSGVSTLSRLASSDCGPLGSLMAFSLSMENLTSEDVSACPLANLRFGLSLQVKVVGAVKSQRCAMSGFSSPLPGTKFIRNGYTWFITCSDPLSYEPAGSSEETLSVVPTVRY